MDEQKACWHFLEHYFLNLLRSNLYITINILFYELVSCKVPVLFIIYFYHFLFFFFYFHLTDE